MRSRAVILVALLLAGWPVLRWYAIRADDGSDERWGIAALIAALIFAPWRSWLEPFPARRWPWFCAALVVYVAALPFAPPMVRALLFVTALAIAAADRRAPVAWGALLFLSLPVIASAQFYAGYPMRFITTKLTVPVIALFGQSVDTAGTTLLWRGEQVVLDAPCSGIHMLWTGLFFASLTACWFRLDSRACLRLLQFTSLTVFAANVLRAAALFFYGTNLWPHWPGHHKGTGLILFGAAMLLILRRADQLAPTQTSPKPETGPPVTPLRPVAQFCLCGLFITAGLLPFRPGAGVSQIRHDNFPGWQSAPLDSRWQIRELGPQEARFAQEFPGRLAVFGDGASTCVVRWVDHPTRWLHPASYCMRAMGFTISPGPIQARSDGTRWNTAIADQDHSRLEIQERLTSSDGRHTWTDVSSWYWQTVFGRSPGPWWMITEISPKT